MPGFFDNVGVEKTTNNAIYDQLYTDIADSLNVGYGIALPEITRNERGEREFNWANTSYTNHIPMLVKHLMEFKNNADPQIDILNHRVEQLEGIVERLEQENEFLKKHIQEEKHGDC